MQVIPGNGHTFSDQNYTVIWMPFALRQAGEQTSVGLQMRVFKYLHSSINAKVEIIPTTSQTLYQVDYQKKIPLLQAQFKILQSLDYYGSQLSSVGLTKGFELGKTSLSLTGAVNNRRTVGQSTTNHQTVSSGISIIGPKIANTCTPSFATTLEASPGNNRAIAPYQRFTGNPSLICEPSRYLQTNFSLFVGRVYPSDYERDSILFRINDPSEAGLRIDQASLRKSSEINAATFELLTPSPISWFADSVVLMKKLKLKIFYDIGYIDRPSHETKAAAAGTGFILPLGGDVIGAGTLVLSNFSVLGIFYTEALGEVSHKPRFLFNISGNL